MARRFQRNFARSSTPNRTWAGAAPAARTVIPAASKVLVFTITVDNPGIDETVLRVVGGVRVMFDQSSADEYQLGAIGMCIVTDTAIAAGIASIPDPVTDVQDDVWFFYQSFAQRFSLLTAVGFDADGGHYYPFDSKAKRVVHSGMSIVGVAANAHASNGLEIVWNVRVLGQVRGTH